MQDQVNEIRDDTIKTLTWKRSVAALLNVFIIPALEPAKKLIVRRGGMVNLPGVKMQRTY